MAHYLFNCMNRDPGKGSASRELAGALLEVGLWGVDTAEEHCGALAPGDLVLIYLGEPERLFIGRAQLASAVHPWKPSEACLYPGTAPTGVVLSDVERWDPPVPMERVLARMAPSEKAKADFPMAVARITTKEYETSLAVAASP